MIYSPDGSQQWLNWVLRQRGDGELIGYVQATVQADGRALVAYERPKVGQSRPPPAGVKQSGKATFA